jgi:hypothetical protein
VEYRRHAANRGHIANFNAGLEWITGDYTLLISADDLLTPGALARAVRLLDQHPEVGMVYGRVLRFQSGQPLPTPATTAETCAWQIRAGARWLEDFCNDPSESITSPEAVVRTRLQHEIGGYNANLPHTGDQEMWMRFAAHADIGILDADQAYYRLHDQNMHVQKYSAGVTELRHFKAAFDVCFASYGRRIPDWPRLAHMADTSLARMALWKVHCAFGLNDLVGCRELVALAESLDPNVGRTLLYRRVRLKLRLGLRRWAALRNLTPRRKASPNPNPFPTREGATYPQPPPDAGRGYQSELDSPFPVPVPIISGSEANALGKGAGGLGENESK